MEKEVTHLLWRQTFVVSAEAEAWLPIGTSPEKVKSELEKEALDVIKNNSQRTFTAITKLKSDCRHPKTKSSGMNGAVVTCQVCGDWWYD